MAGSFGYFHIGHRKLLDEAYKTGLKIVVGLTSDQYTSRTKRYKMPVYSERNKAISKYLDSIHADYEVRELGNNQGDAIDNSDYAVIVASRETEKNVRDINVKRIQKGLKPVEIRLVDTVLAQDLFPISSRRIASGEIDSEGRRINPISVAFLVPQSMSSSVTPPVMEALFHESPFLLKSGFIDFFPQHPDTSRAMSENLEDRDFVICLFLKHTYGMDTGRHYVSIVCRILDRYGVTTEGSSGSTEITDSIYMKILKGGSEFLQEYSFFHDYLCKMSVDASQSAIIPRKHFWDYGYTNYFSAQP